MNSARARRPAISASLGATGTTTSSTEAKRVRNARPRPGGTDDDVSAGVRSVGSGMTARNRVPGAKAIGGGSAAPAKTSSLVSARSASSREMAR